MDPISPDVRELSHRDIQPVETKMDGHHLGPSSTYPLGQMYYAAWLLNYLFVVTFPTQPPKKMSIKKLQIKSQYAKLAAFITFKSHSMESHCDSLKNLNAVSQILCNLSGFDKSTSIKNQCFDHCILMNKHVYFPLPLYFPCSPDWQARWSLWLDQHAMTSSPLLIMHCEQTNQKAVQRK